MSVKVYKPEINLREKINEVDVNFGQKGLEVARANTIEEVFDSVGAGRRNLFINGSFDVWQRGTSFSGDGWSADRWFTTASGATVTTSREAFAVGERDVPGNPHYYLRTAYSAGNDRARIHQRVEDVTRFNEVWVTVSGWVRCSDTNTTSPPLDIDFIYNKDTGTTFYDYKVGQIQPVEDWQYFSVTAKTIDITKAGFSGDRLNSSFEVRFGQGASTSTVAYTWDFANLQLEYGKTPTPFERRSLGEELALCQRYYFRVNEPGGKDGVIGVASAYTSTQANFGFINPVQMRSDDGTVTFNSVRIRTAVGSSQTVTMSQQAARKGYTEVNLTIGSTSFNPGDALQVRIDYTGYIAVDHEL